jgi:hypothetical protein
MDRREHHRVQLRLPARLRWTTPFGQKTEVSTTVDISRGGVLVPCGEAHAEGMSLWLTLPYDASMNYGQPEVLARVVRAVVIVGDRAASGGNDSAATRSKGVNGSNGNGQHKSHNGNGHHDGNGANGHRSNGNGNGNGHGNGGGMHIAEHNDDVASFNAPSATHAAEIVAHGESLRVAGAVAATATGVAVDQRLVTMVALRLEIAPRSYANANAIVRLRDAERRMSVRRPSVVPIRVRTEHVPWFEETMTVDCSSDGLKFRSNREYSHGEFLVVSFESADVSPWLGVTESLLRVVRIDREPESPELQIAVCRSQQFSFRF